MKIFNGDENNKKVYVQLNDLAMLYNMNIEIPSSINSIFANKLLKYSKKNNTFLCFEDKESLLFFNSVDWIIDFKKYRKMNEYETINQGVKVENEINDIIKSNKKNYKSNNNYKLLNYKRSSIADMLLYKIGIYNYYFPNVIDSNGITIDNKNSNYIAQSTFDKNKIFISLKNNECINNPDNISILVISDFIRDFLKTQYDNEMDFNMENISLSADKKSLIVTFESFPYKKNKIFRKKR